MCFLLNAQICERLFHRKYLGKADFCTGFQFSSNLHLTGFGAFLHNSVLIDSSDIFIAAGPGKAGWIKNWACIHVWTVVVGIQSHGRIYHIIRRIFSQILLLTSLSRICCFKILPENHNQGSSR